MEAPVDDNMIVGGWTQNEVLTSVIASLSDNLSVRRSFRRYCVQREQTTAPANATATTTATMPMPTPLPTLIPHRPWYRYYQRFMNSF